MNNKGMGCNINTTAQGKVKSQTTKTTVPEAGKDSPETGKSCLQLEAEHI